MRVFINAILVHTFLNLYVFWKGWKIIPPKYAYRIPFALIFIIELAVYLFGFVLVDEISVYALYPIMIIGTSWMVFILYMAFLLLGYDIVNILTTRIKFLQLSWHLNKMKYKRLFFTISIMVVIMAMVYGSYRFWHPVVTELELTVNKKTEIKKLKIVMVADIHAGYMVNKRILSMYIDKIMEQQPDLILLAGDIIDYDLYPLNAENMQEEFRRLKAPYGVYGSTGNHEYRLDGEAKIKWLIEEAGITMLRDTAVLVNGLFYVLGREDDKAPSRKSLEKIMQKIDRKLPIIVINHEPHKLIEEAVQNVDVAFYGHTHNGQLFPYNLFIHLMYELPYGYKKKENTHMYVTSGLGLSGPQYRIGTLSEIVVANIRFE